MVSALQVVPATRERAFRIHPWQILCAGLLGLVIGTSPAAAQNSAARSGSINDWSNVTALRSGSDLRVESATERVVGSLVSATAEELTLTSGGVNRTLRQDIVRRVVLLGGRKTGHGAKRGFLVGAVLGGLVGVFATRSNRPVWGAFLGVTWGGIGAAIGAFDGRAAREEQVVYSW